MAGFLKIVSGELMEEWGWRPEYGAADPNYNGLYCPKARLFNNHPAILPFTAGEHGKGAHAKALELYRQGIITHTAMTWHLSQAAVDAGPVIDFAPVEIKADDDIVSLSARVQNIEKKRSAEVIDEHLANHSVFLKAA